VNHKYFALALMLSGSALATTFKVELKTKANEGGERTWVLERTSKEFLYNGLVLPPTHLYRNPAALKTLLNSHQTSPSKQACDIGNYELLITKNKGQRETGCMSATRFGELRSAFESLIR
jgi:hypothetical protein